MRQHSPAGTNAFVVWVAAVFLAVMVGWILKIGQAILLPIFIAVISVYVLTTAADALGRVPVVGALPGMARRLLVLLAFAAVIVALAGVVVATVEQLVATAPSYQANLEHLLAKGLATLGMESNPDWQAIRDATIGRINLQGLVVAVLGSIGSVAGTVILIVVYALFLMSEKGTFARKLAIALPNLEQADHTQAMIRDINARIGDYLAIKTLVNVILSVISFVILRLWGVDFAVFWALMIGLLNYIPYVGSLLGVLFPVLLTLGQFGSLTTTLAVAALLTVAQMWVGNSLEPRMIGRKVNLSPFVVLVALSVWSALWGLPGAILAIPMTSMLAIVFAAFAATRPLAVLLADDVEAFAGDSDA